MRLSLAVVFMVSGCIVPETASTTLEETTAAERRWTDECEEFEPDGGHCVASFPIAEARAACDAGNGCACMKLGGAIGCKKESRREATEYFQRACDANTSNACHNLGVIVFWGLDVPADKVRGLALWEKSCDGGYEISCNAAAEVLENGDTVRPDVERAAAFRAKAAALRRARTH